MKALVTGCRLLFLLLAMAAAQGETYDRPRWYPPDHLQRTAEALRLAAPPANRSCESQYRALTADGRLRIAVFFGFMNLELSGIVLDPYNRHDLQRHLLRPCPPRYHVCGFRPDPVQPDLLVKQVKSADGKPLQMEIRLWHSSLGDDYQAILSHPQPRQERHSKAVQSAFLDSLDGVDALFYIGHSRLGSGPGFAPLPWFSRNWLDVWLLDPLMPKISDRLKKSAHPPALIGLLACTTKHYYLSRLQEASPRTTWIGTLGDTYSDQDNAALLGALNALLGRYCRGDFVRSLRAGTNGGDLYEMRHWFNRSAPAVKYNPLPWMLRDQ